MRKRCVGKNVDLKLLIRCAEDFFHGKGFKTKIDESNGEYKILVISQRAPNMREDIDLRILGNSNDFTVEFSGGNRARDAILLGRVTAALGGGGLLLRGLKSREALERLEMEFWVHVEHCIERLASSAGS